jgi:glycosyltransferase involved in cell wall biosynthesis
LGVPACVITFNEEVSIQECFESVAWTDEIIVVDSFSTGKKMEIWRTSTDRVFFRK